MSVVGCEDLVAWTEWMCPYLTFPPQIGPIRVGEHCPFEASILVFKSCGELGTPTLRYIALFDQFLVIISYSSIN